MTHEFKKIIQNYLKNRGKGQQSVIATVVDLEGSSYRKPGVRMLIGEDGTITGAVSGGCVEKEILRQAKSVFTDNYPKIMTYDGRYRLGCEGILYILIELFNPIEAFINNFNSAIEERKNFQIRSYFSLEEVLFPVMGSVIQFSNESEFPFSANRKINEEKLYLFEHEMKPCFKLLLSGAEHDAVHLCEAASLLGWEVTLFVPPTESKTIQNFPGAKELLNISTEEISNLTIDNETAVVLMNHNYAKDLNALIALKDTNPAYIGLLGPINRREKLFNEFLEHCPETDDTFLGLIHGPAGLNVGAETPEEITISILAEILAVKREKEPFSLKNKSGTIHI